MRLFFVLSVAAPLVALGCSPSLPTTRDLGVINLKDTTDGTGPGGQWVFKPQGVFWVSNNTVIPNSTIVPDSCINQRYVPPDTTTKVLNGTQLDAGSPIQVSTSTGIGTMTPDTIPNVIIIYKSAGFISHNPGTDVTYTVPGAAGGFGAGVIQSKTPKVLQLGPIDSMPADSLTLTWNTGTPGTSAVNIALIYSAAHNSTYDSEILCSLYDDGEFTIQPKQVSGWAAAHGHQMVAALRWISTFKNVENNNLLVVESEFDTSKTTFP